MFCKNCGAKVDNAQNYCNHCGTPVTKEFNQSSDSANSQTKNRVNVGRVVGIIIALIFIGVSIYGALDEDSIDSNNQALTSFDSGDSQAAIEGFENAADQAVTNATKLNVLKNLGYVHATESQYEEALTAFNEALTLTDKDSFDYYLISAEIALLHSDAQGAYLNFTKAHALLPNDFQVNNSMALFFLDLEEVAPEYVDDEKALFHAKIAYENDPEKSEIVKQNLAVAYFFNENFTETISLLSTTNLDQHPHMLYWLTWAYIAQGDETNARFYFQKANEAGVEFEDDIYEYL